MTNAEIDRAVAEKVLGWSLRDPEFPEPGEVAWWSGPNAYSRDAVDWRPTESISDAWQVVERMKASDWRVSIEDFNNRYRINFSAGTRWMHENNVEHINVPLGICLAALRALGIDPEGANDGVA